MVNSVITLATDGMKNMNPSLLTPFTEHACPAWVCPLCQNESMTILAGSFHSGVTPASLDRWQSIEGEWEDLELVFSCLLKCDLGRCGTLVAASGSGFVIETPWEEREQGEPEHTELFKARSFTPSLNAFKIPARCPANVIEPLRLSFALYLSAPGPAANAIRIALEELMTALGVVQTGSLFSRINALPSQYSEHQAALTAMRLLGNAGSHTLDTVTSTDIEQAYTIIEFVLRKIFEGSTESVRQLTARLDERFRPSPRPA